MVNKLGLLGGMSLALGALVVSSSRGIFLGFPLAIILGGLMLVLRVQGTGWRSLLHRAWMGGQKALPVYTILLLVGGVMAAWLAAGTVPALVYYGTQWLSPRWFVLWAFGLSAMVSTLLGTSFGAAGTIGVVLMAMAQGSGSNLNLIAGGILAGIYVGDRCSPLSSSALLIASLTGTDLYANLRAMLRTSLMPLGLSVLAYALLARFNPVPLSGNPITAVIPGQFNVHPVVLLPAIALLGLALVQVEVKRAIAISVGLAGAIALTLQHQSFSQVAQAILWGFEPPRSSPLAALFKGGGLIPMLRLLMIVALSTALAGVLEGCTALANLQRGLGHWITQAKPRGRSRLFWLSGGIGLLASAVGCTQTIGILATQQSLAPLYHDLNPDQPQTASSQLALDLENTVVVLAPLIPWNIAGLVPISLLGVTSSCLPYAIYLYVLPIWVGLGLRVDLNMSSQNPDSPTIRR